MKALELIAELEKDPQWGVFFRGMDGIVPIWKISRFSDGVFVLERGQYPLPPKEKNE